MDVFEPDSLVIQSVSGAIGSVLDGQPAPATEKIPNPKAGEKIDRFCKLRSRIQLGSGELNPVIEKELVGLNVGDVKEFEFTMPTQIPDKEFAGKNVKFKVEVLDIKQEQPKPQTTTVPESTAGQEDTNESKVSE
jgi:FKBP-type peptidyl-prolyl cis-trans isomerase 2